MQLGKACNPSYVGTEEDDIRLKTCLPKHLTEQYPVSNIATTERDGSKSGRVGTSVHKDLGSSYRLIFYTSQQEKRFIANEYYLAEFAVREIFFPHKSLRIQPIAASSSELMG